MKAKKTNGVAIGEAVLEILVELGIEPNDIHEEAYLVEDLGVDSTELVEIVVALEKRFGIRIPDRVNVKAKPTVGGLTAIVERLVRDQRGRTA